MVDERPPDKELVTGALSGKDGCYELLVNKYKSALYTYIRRRGLNMSIADDLVQDTFSEAYYCLKSCRQPEKFGGWLFAIARNKIGKLLRSKREVPILSLQLAGDNPKHVQEEAEYHLQLSRRLESELSTLSAQEHKILKLKHQDNRSCQEISIILNIPLGTVTSILSRTYKKLRTKLSEERQ